MVNDRLEEIKRKTARPKTGAYFHDIRWLISALESARAEIAQLHRDADREKKNG